MSTPDKDLPDDPQELRAEFEQLLVKRKQFEAEIEQLREDIDTIFDTVPKLRKYFSSVDLDDYLYEAAQEDLRVNYQYLEVEDPLTGEFVHETTLMRRDFGDPEKLAEPKVKELRATFHHAETELEKVNNRLNLIRTHAAIQKITLPTDKKKKEKTSSGVTARPEDWEHSLSHTKKATAAILEVDERTIYNYVKKYDPPLLEELPNGRISTASIKRFLQLRSQTNRSS